MTDDIKGKVVGAAADARDRGGHRWMAVIGGAAVLSFLALAALLWLRGNELQQEVAALANSDQQNHSAAQTLAQQVKDLGGTPKVSPPPGPTGAPGPTGPAGRGITGTAISGGHLFVSYSDGATEDKGQVLGADGKPGSAGRGITGANATSGHLVLSYSDGSTADAGQVVGRDGAVGATGAAGRGVASVSTANSHLMVTYTDGTTQDAGPLPAGPPGPQGPPGATGAPGPACPAGYEQHQARITASDGSTYDGVACVKPSSSTPPSTSSTLPLLPGHGH